MYISASPVLNEFGLQIKSFHAELLIPTENKQENEFKQVSVSHLVHV